MSAAIVEMLARRWNCSRADVARAVERRLVLAGLLPNEAATVHVDAAAIDQALAATDGRPHRRLTLGVTDDDRIFVLDEHDRPLLEL